MLPKTDATGIGTKKTLSVFGFIIIFFAFHALTASSLFVGYGYDREVFRYFGMLMANGGIPYLDAFDHKPPMIYFLYFIGHLLKTGPWGGFIVLQILGAVSALMLFDACKKHLNLTCSFIVTLFYISLIKYSHIISGGGLTRELSAYLIVILFAVNLRYKRSHWNIFQSGILFTIIFYTQQNEILATIPLLTYFIVSDLSFKDKKSFLSVVILKRGAIFITGCLLIHALIITLFLQWNAMNNMIEQAFLFNTNHYIPKTSLLIRFAKVVYFCFGREEYYPLLLALLLTAYPVMEMVYKKKKLYPSFYFISLALLLQLVAMSLSMRPLSHYCLSLIPYFVIAIYYLLRNYPEDVNIVMNRERIMVATTTLIVTLSVVKWYYYTHPKKRINAYKHDEEVYSEIRKVQGQRGQLYVFHPSYLALNTDLDIISPSKWIYQHFFLWQGIDDGEQFKTVLRDLETHKCTYILVPHYPSREPPVPLPESIYKELEVYLSKNYTLLLTGEDGNLYLYQRKQYDKAHHISE